MIVEKLILSNLIEDLVLDIQFNNKINQICSNQTYSKNQSDDDEKIIELLEDIKRD